MSPDDGPPGGVEAAEPLVCIVDDDEGIRDALGWLLRSRGLASLSFSSAEAFLGFVQAPGPPAAGRPSCVLLDVRMAGISGIELFGRLRAPGPWAAVPVIFLTGHGDVPMAVEALKRGAFDFFEKPFSDNALVDRVIAAIELAELRQLEDRTQAALIDRLGALTQREREVMDRILAGKLNKVIADELQISMRTVEVHRARLFVKMGVRSAVELANLLR